jgi:hypothetical protein
VVAVSSSVLIVVLNNHYVDGENSSSIPVDQVLISKTEYDSLLQRANASSSS